MDQGRGHGGVKPSPPTVHSVQHAGAVAVPERATMEHSVVKEGGGAEAMALGRIGGKCGYLKGVQRLWKPPWDGDLLQIPGNSDIGGR